MFYRIDLRCFEFCIDYYKKSYLDIIKDKKGTLMRALDV